MDSDDPYAQTEAAQKDIDGEGKEAEAIRLLKLEKQLKWKKGILPNGKKGSGENLKDKFTEAQLHSSRFGVYPEVFDVNLNSNQFVKKDFVTGTIYQVNKEVINFLETSFKKSKFVLLQRVRKILPWISPFIQAWIKKHLGEEEAKNFYQNTQPSSILNVIMRQPPHFSYQAIYEVDGKDYSKQLMNVAPDCADICRICYEKCLKAAISQREEVDDNFEGLKSLIKIGLGLKYEDFMLKLEDNHLPVPFGNYVITKEINFKHLQKQKKQRPKRKREQNKRKLLQQHLNVTDHEVEKLAKVQDSLQQELEKLKKENNRLKEDQKRMKDNSYDKCNNHYYRFRGR